MIYEATEKLNQGSEKMPFKTHDGLEGLDVHRRDRFLLSGDSQKDRNNKKGG